jgi:uncharacterized protein (DUF952 family)
MSNQFSNSIYKIITKANWKRYLNENGILKTSLKEDLISLRNHSAVFRGFDNDINFIHFSIYEQLEHVYKYKFNSDGNKLLLMNVDINNSKSFVYEKSSNGQYYPHSYSPLVFTNKKYRDVPYINWVVEMDKIIFF